MDAQTLTKVWVSAHQPVTQEVQATLPIVEGELPDDLRGVLYRNGPGRLSIGDEVYGHLFDGDGMILRFAIGATSADSRPRIRYRNRYVRTREFVHEERAGRILYRGLGTNLPGGIAANFLRLRFKNPANTNIVHHGGRLLALWEGGLPHQLDPVTLDTLGPCDFAGGLRNRTPHTSWVERRIAAHLPFSAHPKVDPATGDLYNFGVVLGPQPRLHIYRVDPRGQFQMGRIVPLSQEPFLHDFMLTPHWFVFFLYPVTFDSGRALLGFSTGIDSLRPIAGAPTQVLLVPRDGGDVRQFVAAPCFVFHFCNAYEDAAGQIVIDGCRQAEYPVMPPLSRALSGQLWDFPLTCLTRYTIDPAAPAGSSIAEQTLPSHAVASGEPAPVPTLDGVAASDSVSAGLSLEFPRLHPAWEGRPYRYVWGIAAAPGSPYHLYTSLVRHDLQTGQTLRREFAPWLPGEPVMVPRVPIDGRGPAAADGAAEDDGYILTVVYHGQTHRSALHVLDARTLATVCVAQLPHHTPPGFHGNFVPAADCPPGWTI